MRPLDVEKAVRERLGEMYGTRFRKVKLIIGYKCKGEPQIHEFDLTSENRTIIGEVKSGKCTTTNCSLALTDCFYLSKVKSKVKLMVFTNKRLYELFKEKSRGLIGDNIQLLLLDISGKPQTLMEQTS